MTIETDKDVIGLVKIGKVVGQAIQFMREKLHPGMTTKELDAIGEAFLKEHGARSAPVITYRFPGITCISIDEVAAHGIPGKRVIHEGELVKIDVSAELNGYFADANITVPVGEISAQKQKLLECGKAALDNAIAAARPGQPLNGIGRAAEDTAKRYGFHVIRDLPGHGVGRALHEAPSVPNFYMRRADDRLQPGMVFTIEPHISAGSAQIKQGGDGWTLSTRDGSPVVSFEHTVVITDDEPILLTAV